MDLEDAVRQFLEDPHEPEEAKEGIRALWSSHLTPGIHLQRRGLYREALAQYAKEHDRPIKSSIDAEIVQSSYWHVGVVHRALGDLEKAVEAFEKALELFHTHRVGICPVDDLAEVLIDLGKVDDAIAVCQDSLARAETWPTRQILERALRLKEEATE